MNHYSSISSFLPESWHQQNYNSEDLKPSYLHVCGQDQLTPVGMASKLSIGLTGPRPCPTLPRVALEALRVVTKSPPIKETKAELLTTPTTKVVGFY
ncbi:hypothetical protein [Methanolobus sp.]|uniref:hypothetical protein n=1 Tax=Methanolobus sp. TaxID=1874737 RepID=UPI0025CBC0A2|nr:hypothetical protein [Methanolobus sp.]